MKINVHHELSPKIPRKSQHVVKTTYEIVKSDPISKEDLEYKKRQLIRLILKALRRRWERMQIEVAEK